MKKILVLMLSFVLFAFAALAQDKTAAANTQPAAWAKIQSLAGDWKSEAGNDKEKPPTHITFRPSSGGTAFVQTIDPGGKYEMVTVFHLDGPELLGTHYCMGNQPRFRAVAAKDANTLVFELKDMTGKDAPGHMARLVITMLGPDHHYEDWTYLTNGKETTDRFDLHRVK